MSEIIINYTTLVILISNVLLFFVINRQIIKQNHSITEASILTEVNQARRRYGDSLLIYTTLRAKDGIDELKDDLETEEFRLYEEIRVKTEEELLNVYDTCCGMYLDGKVDKRRFKLNYFTDIENLIDSNKFENHFRNKRNFRSLLEVYYQWIDKE